MKKNNFYIVLLILIAIVIINILVRSFFFEKAIEQSLQERINSSSDEELKELLNQ